MTAQQSVPNPENPSVSAAANCDFPRCCPCLEPVQAHINILLLPEFAMALNTISHRDAQCLQ
jgi:hypothetical protein